MKICDEYKCRRCGVTFRSEPGDSIEERLEDYVSEEIVEEGRGSAGQLLHVCSFGGIGIGDWIGASEIKEAGL